MSRKHRHPVVDSIETNTSTVESGRNGVAQDAATNRPTTILRETLHTVLKTMPEHVLRDGDPDVVAQQVAHHLRDRDDLGAAVAAVIEEQWEHIKHRPLATLASDIVDAAEKQHPKLAGTMAPPTTARMEGDRPSRETLLGTLKEAEETLLAQCGNQDYQIRNAVATLRTNIDRLGNGLTPKAVASLESNIKKIVRKFAVTSSSTSR